MTHKVDQLKSKGEYEAAGRLAFREKSGRSYGCHFGMKSDLDKAKAEFFKGYDLESKKPIISLKKVKVAANLSEETVAYTADVYVNGQFLAHASNHGHGGADELQLAKGKTWDDVRALNKLIEETYPTTEYHGLTLKESLEALCQQMAGDERLKTNFRSRLSRYFLFEKEGGIFQIKKVKGQEAAHLAHIKAKYPNSKILNTLPFDEAWELYIASAEG